MRGVSSHLRNSAAAQKASDLVVREQREDVEALGAILEQEAQFQVPATLEGRGAKLADRKTVKKIYQYRAN
jgi:hypothetical protein